MTTIREALTLAGDHHCKGEHSDAEGIYRLILIMQPDNVLALYNLGLLVAPGEAVDLFSRALTLQPDYTSASINLARTLQAQGHLLAAAAVCQDALALAPDHPDLLFRLGHILQIQGKLDDAASRYEQAIALQPDRVAALCSLGAVHGLSNRAGAAAECYRRALAIDAGSEFANINLAGILESDGRQASAKVFRDRVPRPQNLQIATSTSPRRTVLVLANSGNSNVPIGGLLPPATTTSIIWPIEYATDAQEAELPPYDVAFNAVGNADVMAESFARMTRFHARRPILNPPAAVAQTRRDLMPQLLAGIPGLCVPAVVRLGRDEATGLDLPARLAAGGVACPALVRPIATHGGAGMTIVQTPEEFAGLSLSDADAFYFTHFQDYRGPDGYYRKYRMIFVDRQAYPYHLAISKNWLVHYFSADMLAAPWKREEERRFLENPADALGAQALVAVAAIGRRLDMDFAGIDFSILPDGRVVVFEANATMLVHLNDTVQDFPYKHVAVPAIFTAFDAMLDRHTAAAD